MSGTGDARPRPGRPPGRVQRCPFVVHCEPGKYALCRCRRSAAFPYCDGSHRAIENPGAADRPVKVLIEAARTVAWCSCLESANHPFCDGTHARLPLPEPDGSV